MTLSSCEVPVLGAGTLYLQVVHQVEPDEHDYKSQVELYFSQAGCRDNLSRFSMNSHRPQNVCLHRPFPWFTSENWFNHMGIELDSWNYNL